MPQIDPWTGERFWIVARHGDVLTGLRHPDIGHQVPGAPPPDPSDEIGRIGARQLINIDPPDHTRLRALVSRAFTPRSIAALEPRIVTIVDALIDGLLERGSIDGVAELGEPMPVAVIAELIGVPVSDRALFRGWSTAIMTGEGREAATLEFAAWTDALAAARRAAPRDDLISRLVALDDLTRDELVGMVQLLLIAGQETAVFVIVNGLRALLRDRAQWECLCADPGLAAAAVEEIVRFDGPVEIAPPRYALREVWLGGGAIPAFEKVGLALLGANRDAEAFDVPDVFDIRRADVSRHVGFGHGIHYCLGAALGRLEGRIMFARLAQRVPSLHLAAPVAGSWIEPHTGALPLEI